MELLYVKLDDHKLVENPEFTQAINHLIQVLNKEKQANTDPPPAQQPDEELVVRNSEGETPLIIKDISFLEGSGNSVVFNYISKVNPNLMLKVGCGKHIKTYQDLLTEHGFFRCHQSYIVNLNRAKLAASERCFVITVNGKCKTLPISTRCWKRHKQMLQSLPAE
jgi:DNA-binding LytR/AlgR family response regulator